ncbi:hypothetical protein HK102_013433 [Quaeritorhiza haematococci]|nr:hypothetical protein HK102_013433 [Quaeritorhiza haematococci]
MGRLFHVRNRAGNNSSVPIFRVRNGRISVVSSSPPSPGREPSFSNIDSDKKLEDVESTSFNTSYEVCHLFCAEKIFEESQRNPAQCLAYNSSAAAQFENGDTQFPRDTIVTGGCHLHHGAGFFLPSLSSLSVPSSSATNNTTSCTCTTSKSAATTITTRRLTKKDRICPVYVAIKTPDHAIPSTAVSRKTDGSRSPPSSTSSSPRKKDSAVDLALPNLRFRPPNTQHDCTAENNVADVAGVSGDEFNERKFMKDLIFLRALLDMDDGDSNRSIIAFGDIENEEDTDVRGFDLSSGDRLRSASSTTLATLGGAFTITPMTTTNMSPLVDPQFIDTPATPIAHHTNNINSTISTSNTLSDSANDLFSKTSPSFYVATPKPRPSLLSNLIHDHESTKTAFQIIAERRRQKLLMRRQAQELSLTSVCIDTTTSYCLGLPGTASEGVGSEQCTGTTAGVGVTTTRGNGRGAGGRGPMGLDVYEKICGWEDEMRPFQQHQQHQHRRRRRGLRSSVIELVEPTLCLTQASDSSLQKVPAPLRPPQHDPYSAACLIDPSWRLRDMQMKRSVMGGHSVPSIVPTSTTPLMLSSRLSMLIEIGSDQSNGDKHGQLTPPLSSVLGEGSLPQLDIPVLVW